jgi:ubiquinone/menaquinone biosynthesis C-methylase UbiE
VAPAAFDPAAQHYDEDFTRTDLGYWLRERVWARLADLFQPGASVLEIGCGTGEDAVWLARRGVSVLATDASLAMLRQTAAKAQTAGVAGRIETRPLDLKALPEHLDGLRFDGVFSNFGAINCTDNWPALATFLEQIVRPQGRVGLGVMSPFCLWETLWHGLHLDFATAFRRFNRRASAQLPGGRSLTVYYPTPGRLARAFQPHFQQTAIMGLGVFIPPSDIFPVIERRPALARRLVALERQLASSWPFRAWADHFWIEFAHAG